MTDDERWRLVEVEVIRKLRKHRADIINDDEIRTFTITAKFPHRNPSRAAGPSPKIERVLFSKESGDDR